MPTTATMPKGEKSEAKTVAATDAAIAKFHEDNARFEQGEREWKESAERHYLEFLKRSDNPMPKDAELLTQIIRDLELSPEKVKDDEKIVKRVFDLQELHAKREEARDVLYAKRNALADLKRRHKEELLEARMAVGRAETHHSECDSAARELLLLAGRRPSFFDKTNEPPTLRTS
ncbi:hypothetical protein Pan216_12730 [Planctomycetes bacterium Pan216]|uniref:Uncharacterized protein n=1 Tax=Kolteria novifilia TaxID=2527975 RepID=A0A518B0F6_9BACT|nr:hypothetical protein Pan216_12730 [Planctomycetes bacterium Pan216]